MFLFVAQECKKTWANLRDAYRRAIKKSATVSGQKAKNLKKWKYESEMEFLKPYMKERDTISSVEPKSDVEKSSSDSENELNFSKNEINKSGNITMESIISPEENIANSTPSEGYHPSELSPKFCKPPPKKIMTAKKRKKNEGHASSESASSLLIRYIIEKEKKEEIKANTEKNEINLIDQFFQNMGSTVKQFSPYHQHLAKTRVFSVISELELDHIKSQKLHEQQYQQQYQQQNISALQPIYHSTQNYTDGSISHHSDSDTSSNVGNFLTTFIP